MNRSSTMVRWFLALVLVVGIGCPGDYQAPPDTQSGSDYYGPTPDWPQVPPDGPQWPDYGQPDWYQPPKPDLWYWPPDTGYVGAPFGCHKDSDCFGLKCCETPWGVKLCAETCPQ